MENSGLQGITRKVTDLRALDLTGTRVTNAGIKFLHKLPNLEELDISYSAITASAATNLAQLTQLKKLRAISCWPLSTDITHLFPAGIDIIVQPRTNSVVLE